MSFCALTATNVHKASTAAVSLFLFFICFPSHLFLSERTIVFSTMAGLLTFPQYALPSQPCCRPVTFSKQTLCLRGLQLQVQFRTLTGFPCIEMAIYHPITINFAAKVLLFSPTTNQSARIFQNKKEKGTEIHCKITNFQHQNSKRDPVGTIARNFMSRYDTLKDCDLVIYEKLPSHNNRLKPLLYHKRGYIVSPQKIRRCLSSKREVT